MYVHRPMSSRSESKKAAREARLAAEQEEASKQRRQRIWALVGGSVLLAAIVVVVLIVISSGGSDRQRPARPATSPSSTGSRSSGIELGDPKAPVTMVEFADLQCPFCKEYTADVLPDLVEKYVKSGDLRMELNLLTFIGPDSQTLAAAAYAAGAAGPDVAVGRRRLRPSGRRELRLRRQRVRRLASPRRPARTPPRSTTRQRLRPRSAKQIADAADGRAGRRHLLDPELPDRPDRRRADDARTSTSSRPPRSRTRSTSSSPTRSEPLSRLWADRPTMIATVLTLAGIAIATYLTCRPLRGPQPGLHDRRLRARPGVELLGDRPDPGRPARADRLRR